MEEALQTMSGIVQTVQCFEPAPSPFACVLLSDLAYPFFLFVRVARLAAGNSMPHAWSFPLEST